ncbi:sulfotransferase 2A1-like isoform X1 [Peromyscus maniculatus bairdii]|uniref:sulfotransferase 2A1-like isoform X1 n=1 Tax=Peromyscus maniculatus bairdii TaxID=230844 RepID=UPI003FD221BE
MSAYFWFEGIPLSTIVYKREIIEESRDKFVIRDEDTVILSYPKSGTNWLKETVCLIQTKGNPKWIQSVPIWERSPWIETQKGFPILINKEGPRLMSSHLPFHLFPKSFFRSKAKVIYIIRNPKDILVSGYFFQRNTNLIDNPESLGTYIEWFLKGNDSWSSTRGLAVDLCIQIPQSLDGVSGTTIRVFGHPITRVVPYGSWFEHTRDWLSMRENDNFLLLSYEDMKKNTRGTIRKICDFLGKKLEPDELDLVLKYSSFQAMKENKMSNFSLT